MGTQLETVDTDKLKPNTLPRQRSTLQRIEKGKLKFPDKQDKAMKLNRDQLSWLLSGLDFTKQKCTVLAETKYIY